MTSKLNEEDAFLARSLFGRDSNSFGDVYIHRRFWGEFDRVELPENCTDEHRDRLISKENLKPFKIEKGYDWNDFLIKLREEVPMTVKILKAEIYSDLDDGEDIFRCCLMRDGIAIPVYFNHPFNVLTDKTIMFVKRSAEYFSKEFALKLIRKDNDQAHNN